MVHVRRVSLFILVLGAVAIWLLPSTRSRADAVVLISGDTIEGKLVERNDFAIILDNPGLARVEIPRERIDSLKAKSPEFKR